MRKIKVIGTGMSFADDWRAKHGDDVAVRADGNKVEVRKGTSPTWYPTKVFGEEIIMLIWEPNGRISALQKNGKLSYVTNLSPTPNRYQTRTIEIEEPQRPQESSNSKKSSRRKQDDDKESFFSLENILALPFKLVWWIIKGIWKSL